LSSASIAHRMSWMANRVTTRPEDMAYCLLGIFSVHMPLLYGEGDQAFLRLQEEIMKASYDQSIFAWRVPGASGLTGILATSPEYFRHSGHILPSFTSSEPYSITNRGLRISLNLQLWGTSNQADLQNTSENNQFLATLDCIDGRWLGESSRLLAIRLVRVQRNSNDFARMHPPGITRLEAVSYDRNAKPYTIYIATRFEAFKRTERNDYEARVLIKNIDLHHFTLRLFQSVEANESRNPTQFIIKIPHIPATVAHAMVFEKNWVSQYDERTAILVTIGSNYAPHLQFRPKNPNRTSRDLDYIAFDAHVGESDSLRDPVKLLTTAQQLFAPYSLGMELFVGDFAVTVKQAPVNDGLFDPHVLNALVRIRELTAWSHRPPNGRKWQHPAMQVNDHYSELEDSICALS
jgi:hypothetical protein